MEYGRTLIFIDSDRNEIKAREFKRNSRAMLCSGAITDDGQLIRLHDRGWYFFERTEERLTLKDPSAQS
jgi:hypothetical protein